VHRPTAICFLKIYLDVSALDGSQAQIILPDETLDDFCTAIICGPRAGRSVYPGLRLSRLYVG
jgi:hypothetical protein